MRDFHRFIGLLGVVTLSGVQFAPTVAASAEVTKTCRDIEFVQLNNGKFVIPESPLVLSIFIPPLPSGDLPEALKQIQSASSNNSVEISFLRNRVAATLTETGQVDQALDLVRSVKGILLKAIATEYAELGETQRSQELMSRARRLESNSR